MSMILERDTLSSLPNVLEREWLVTNGLGGYASSTLSGCNTRRYHGLLVAALRPPVERTVLVAKMDALVHYRKRTAALFSNEFRSNAGGPPIVDGQSHLHLHEFRLDGTLPIWTWAVDDALIEQRVWMSHGQNTTYVTYEVLRASDRVELTLTPLCTYRDYHWQVQGAREFQVSHVERGIRIDAHWGAHPYRLLADNATVEFAPDWYWNFKHRAESDRGLDDAEDLFRPAVIRVSLRVGERVAVTLTAENAAPASADQALHAERARQAELLRQALGTQREQSRPLSVEQLVLAADQYIVERRDAAGKPLGKTVIAGYPWFSDWGRDTMIALPGLTLATRRYDVAASILRTFAKFVSEGMLPNRFPDAGEQPEYNTVDATLWYFVAVDEYYRASGDLSLVKELFPVLEEILVWHQRGTRYGIRVAEDGLLRAGEPGVQLTWMDAKIGDWVVTPRIGKPVEINALWFNALSVMSDFAIALHHAGHAHRYAQQAAQTRASFRQRFWNAERAYLFDVVDGPEGDDAALRPNQLLAISLHHGLLDDDQARSIVDWCARELWTPVGLRSLARDADEYAAHYAGGPRERDAVYHQGTVWSWLLGLFALAHYRAFGDTAAAKQYLNGIDAHLREACVGQVSEIFDGEAPYVARGCFAQAWGISEVLRAWSELNECEHQDIRTRKAS